MTQKIRFFKHVFLRSVALAIALLVQASPARAEVVTLICQQEAGTYNTATGGSFTLRVDYDQKIVDFLGADGSARFSAMATITESDVRWDDVGKNKDEFLGGLNRLSGQGNAAYMDGRGFRIQMSGPCRRVTKPKF